MKAPKLITILGPTAVGKTGLAVSLADALGGEIISADSRQVFRSMDIGTGKDLADYMQGAHQIPYHLIDIAEPGTEFSLYNFLDGFHSAYSVIHEKGKIPILCGGTGLYLEAVLKGYDVPEVGQNSELRKELETKSDEELTLMLKSFKKLHNQTDTVERERLIRAIEIEHFKKNRVDLQPNDFAGTPIFGLTFSRGTTRANITLRLLQRLKNGLVQEVRGLMDQGISPAALKRYGLEYKFITSYILEELDYPEMYRLLNTAIHQFAKRQMTWFRRMERNGIKIVWLSGEDGKAANLGRILQELGY